MSTFFEFLSAAADFALTLQLKAVLLAAGFIVLLPPRSHLQDRDSWMSSFFEFLSAAADFALTLNLKGAIVAAGFISC